MIQFSVVVCYEANYTEKLMGRWLLYPSFLPQDGLTRVSSKSAEVSRDGKKLGWRGASTVDSLDSLDSLDTARASLLCILLL